MRRRRGSRKAKPKAKSEAGSGNGEPKKRRSSKKDENGARPDRTRFTRALRLGTIGAVLAFGLGWIVSTRLLFPAPPPPRGLVEVPDLRGLDTGDAASALQAAGLVAGQVGRYRHPTVPAGQVLGQSPLFGQMAFPGDTVTMTASLGAERRPVPDVLRLREDWARNVLEASGFVVVRDTLESELPRGRVVEIIPEPGTDVALPMEVQVLVSTGPAQVKMPLLLGMERADAEVLIDSLGLVLGEVTTRFRFGRDQGRVVEQLPPADSLLDPGSEVRIVVGRRVRRGGR